MNGLIDNPARVSGVAALLALVILVIMGSDVFGVVGLLARWAHIVAAMVWGGLIVFMNFLHIRAVERASDTERAGIVKWYVDGLGRLFSASARIVIASGLVLLATSGYVLGSMIFGSAVYVPLARAVPLWIGVGGGLIMAALVEARVRPAFRIIVDPAALPADKAAARARAKAVARINLFLLLPVTAFMIGAAHG